MKNKEFFFESMNQNPWFLDTLNKTKILAGERPLIFFPTIFLVSKTHVNFPGAKFRRDKLALSQKVNKIDKLFYHQKIKHCKKPNHFKFTVNSITLAL